MLNVIANYIRSAKHLIISIFVIFSIVGLIAFGFAVNQVNREKSRLRSDLRDRSLLLAENLKESIEPRF